MKLSFERLTRSESTTVMEQKRITNNNFKTQSTVFVDQLFKHEQYISGSELIDSLLAYRPHPIHFMPKITGHITPKSTDLPALYSDLITKILRQEERKAAFDQISNEFPFIDPVHYECFNRAYEIVFRVWYAKTPNQYSSRLLYIGSQTHASRDVSLFYRVFGQIDLAMIPSTTDYYHEVNLNWIEYQSPEDLSQLSMDTLIRISKYLDHGQCLNLRTLESFMPHHKIKYALSFNSNDAHRQHLRDYYNNQQFAPNGRSLSSFPRSEHVTHLTNYKAEILNSGMISTSNGGCLGNVIYSVKVLRDTSGQEYIGGMSVGLAARLYSSKELDQNKIFLMSIKDQENFLSNWINSFGFGRLKLEAMLIIAKKPMYSLILHKATRESLFLYQRMQPLLAHFKTYCSKREWIEKLTEHQQAILITKEFKVFWDLFTTIRVLPESDSGLRHFYLLNNLLFEVLKDYILLHQTTPDQELFNELGSYDMHNQYQFFFALDPDLKDKGFKTEFFSPDYASIIEHLANHNAIELQNVADELRLQKFLLDRFSAAINIYFLEHQTAPDINPMLFMENGHCIHPFIHHALILPNLFGNIIHSILSKIQNASPREQKLLKEYHQQLRQLYDLSYDERKITVPLKANLFETDEIGVRQLDSTSIHEIQLQATQTSLYKIMNISQPLPLILKGVSDRVQLRAKECEHINTDGLIQSVRLLQQPITDWDQDSLNTLKILLTKHTWPLSHIKQVGLSKCLFAFFYEHKTILSDYEASLTDEEILRDIDFVILMQDIFFLINIKNYRAGYEKLNDFVQQKELSHHQVMDILLSNAKNLGELYQISMLYFSACHVFNTESLAATFGAELIESIQALAQTSDAKVKTLLTQLIIYLSRRRYIDNTTLLFDILSSEQRKERDHNLDIYHEIANFIRFSWRSLVLTDICSYTEAFLFRMTISPTLDSVALVLANISLLPSLRPIFLNRLPNLLSYATMKSLRMLNTTLTILFNISLGEFREKLSLWHNVEAFLLSSLKSYPHVSHKIFMIMNHFTYVMDALTVQNVVRSLEYVAINQPRVVPTMDIFFDGIDHSINQNPPSYLTHEFIAASCSFYNYDQSLIQNSIKFIIESLNFPETKHIVYLKALYRLLQKTPNQTFFLNENGLKTILSIGANLKSYTTMPASHHALAGALLDIVTLFRNMQFIIENPMPVNMMMLNEIDLNQLSDFYDNMLQENDLIGDFTSFILRYDCNIVINKLKSSHSNTPFQVAILTGLSEVEITDEILQQIQASALCATISEIVDEYELLNDDLCQILIKVIVNFYSRSALREQNPFREQLHKLWIDPEYDEDLYADWQNILLNEPEACIFEKSDLYFSSLIASQHALNELSQEQKNKLIDDITELCCQIGHPSQQFALTLLEKFARSKYYSTLLITPQRLHSLTNKLQSLTEDAIHVGIIDTFFWLTVNHHQQTEHILNTGILPILLNHLIGNQATNELIRAILGLLVNVEFTDFHTQSLLPYLDLFIYFLKNQHVKVVINALALLDNIFCIPVAWTYLDEENIFQLYKRLRFLQQKAESSPSAQQNEIYELTQSLLTKLEMYQNRSIRHSRLFENRLHLSNTQHYQRFKRLTSQVALVNRFGLPFLTYHPNIIYKRMKYLPELVAHLPKKDIYQSSLRDLSSSSYTETNYLNATQAENYRLYIKDGLIFSRQNDEEHLFSCAKDEVMVCQSLNGNIYSALKINKLQHTSFNAGGYLLFAGYWHVQQGIIKSIHAESGHYEPSLVALQNFVYLLFTARCDLSTTKFVHIDRKLHDNPTEKLNFVKTEKNYDLNALLTPDIIKPEPSTAISFVNPKSLHLLSQGSIFAQTIVRDFTSASILTSYRDLS